jgi:hypothetical protein
LAEGDEGEDGEDPATKLLRLDVGTAAGGAGESQKNEPRPGEPEKEAAPENDGEALVAETADGRRDIEGPGESMSIPESDNAGFEGDWDGSV